MPLNPRQQAFIREYLVDHNATQAYIRAGYSANGAEGHAARLVADGRVMSEIRTREAKANDRAAAKLDMTKDRVTGAAARLAFADIADIMEVAAREDGTETVRLKDLLKLTPEQRAPIQSIKVLSGGVVEVKLADKLQALRLLSDQLGYIVQKRETRKVTSFDDLSDEELAALEIDTARKLGDGGTRS